MGRKLRRVPPNWEHPKHDGRYLPLFDCSCEDAWTDWQAEYAQWIGGEHDWVIAQHGSDEYPKDQPYTAFCRWNGTPPHPDEHRPQWKEGEATWWQVYETVSEGTPVSPPFATQQELIDYLVKYGDFWDQARRDRGDCSLPCDPWSRQDAEAFVMGSGWAPTLVLDAQGLRSGVRSQAG